MKQRTMKPRRKNMKLVGIKVELENNRRKWEVFIIIRKIRLEKKK